MQGKRGKCEHCSKIFEIRLSQVKPITASPLPKGKSTSPRNTPILSTKLGKAKPQATSHATRPANNKASYSRAEQPQQTAVDTHSVWDSIALPNDISQSLHSDLSHRLDNPYAAFTMGSGSAASSSLFKRCFKLSQKNAAASNVMMFVANLASSALMILLCLYRSE